MVCWLVLTGTMQILTQFVDQLGSPIEWPVSVRRWVRLCGGTAKNCADRGIAALPAQSALEARRAKPPPTASLFTLPLQASGVLFVGRGARYPREPRHISAGQPRLPHKL